MNKIKGKILSILPALVLMAPLVAGVVTSSGSTYAVSGSTTIDVLVDNGDFSAVFTSPKDGAHMAFADGTALVNYANAHGLKVTMTAPDGTVTTLFENHNLAESIGSVGFPYNLNGGYGDYTFTITGEDAFGEPEVGQEITITYSSVWYEVTGETDENGDPIVEVHFDPDVVGGVCIQVYPDSPNTDPNEGLLNPPYCVLGDDFESLPGYEDGNVKITVPISKDPYNLPPGDYEIGLSTYDKSQPPKLIEDGLGAVGGGGFTYSPTGELPPDVGDTGFLSIGGISVAHSDLVASAICMVIIAAGVYLYHRASSSRIRL